MSRILLRTVVSNCEILLLYKNDEFIYYFITLLNKFLQSDLLRAEAFQLNFEMPLHMKYLNFSRVIQKN